MAQTSYAQNPARARAGHRYDSRQADLVSATNEDTTNALLFGSMLREGANEGGARLLSAAGQKMLGVALHFHEDPDLTGLEVDAVGPVLKKGAVWVRVEETIAKGDRVFVRHTATGAEKAGDFRNDADGTAQVATGTPTAVNDTLYELDIEVRSGPDGREDFFHFEALGDGSATATEICDTFRTAMQANAEFDALITSTGTATLILTAADKSTTFDAFDAGAGVMAIAATTASAPDCDELSDKQARWLGASVTVGSDKFAPLALNLV